MTREEAAEILRDHNEWRRDKEVPSSKPMVCPTLLGKAIDFAVLYLEQVEPRKEESA